MSLLSSATAFGMKNYDQFMCIVQKPPEREQSFEVRQTSITPSLQLSILHLQELRVDDYLKAYITTGRPPPPVPHLPDTPKAREALGLPPLFHPIRTESSPSASTSALPSVSPVHEKVITSPSELPTIQVFQTTKAVPNEQFKSITAQATFSHFSFEVRSYKYRTPTAHLRVCAPATDLGMLMKACRNTGIAPICISFGKYHASNSTAI